jgi:hypothetical protein
MHPTLSLKIGCDSRFFSLVVDSSGGRGGWGLQLGAVSMTVEIAWGASGGHDEGGLCHRVVEARVGHNLAHINGCPVEIYHMS